MESSNDTIQSENGKTMKEIIVKKVCGKCGKQKKLTEFPENKRMWGRISSWCKSCHTGEAPTVKETQNKEDK